MGCDVRSFPCDSSDDDGVVHDVRFIMNDENGRFVPLVDLTDSDRVPLREVENWMRQLDKVIPLPP